MYIDKKIPAIAVVGMGCYYPGANNLKQLWENILGRRREFRQFPDNRLPVCEYHEPDKKAPDKSYGSRAAVIDGFEFDWAKRRVPKTAFDSADVAHWLALEVAIQALENAGYTRETVPCERTGVILGNTLTGEQSRTQNMRLRWPFARKALEAAAKAKGMSEQSIEILVETMEKYYKSVFAPITEDTLAGNLANTIAGRVCNFFNFDGGGYVVDGACSSSVISVATACTHLVAQEMDIALAGGVDISLDTFELIGFAKAGALSAGDMNVYDRKASGFIPGEGCGFVVLKRLEDARADGDYVYAVIKGWGISSDGKGGITAPSKVGQSKALRRAYEKADYSSHDLDFIEGHGTGTPVGDRTELEGIALAIAGDGEIAPRSVGVTSFKSLVGHTKAAAGIGGFIKAVMAVNQRVIPPTAGCTELNPVFHTTVKSVYPVLSGEVRCSSDILRAGVSAMGFGGINSHVTLESGDAPANHLKSTLKEQALLVSNQDTELFVLSATSITNLIERIQTVREMAQGMSMSEMVDLAVKLTEDINPSQPIRAALIADTPMTLLERLEELEHILENTPPTSGKIKVSPQEDIWIGNSLQNPRIAFLFPGQGSQKLNMARTLIERHSWAKEFLQQADNWLEEIGFEPISKYIYHSLELAVDGEQMQEWSKHLTQAEIASPAICFVSLLWQKYLQRLGIVPVAVGGHSLGELTAFCAAGAYDEKTLICLAAMRGKAMSTGGDNNGSMASLGCDHQTAEKLLVGVSGYVTIANINSPQQTVISGKSESVAQVVQQAKSQDIQTRQLAVANAFHSKIMSPAASFLREQAQIPEHLSTTSITLFSSINGQPLAKGLQLKQHFANQITSQVDFVSLVKTIESECDLMIEVGPGKVLAGLVKATTNSQYPICIPVESKPGRDRDFNNLLASFFVHGGEVEWQAVYENRLWRAFIPASERIFIENQCERPFDVSDEEISAIAPIASSFIENGINTNSFNQFIDSEEELVEALDEYFSERGSFLAELIRTDLENLPTLLTINQDNRE
ncbi:MAG: type I polyketide synthase [Mastigocoleus sp. MO_167.B18]|uniref:type I polyketide synthase n=1 Tax=Mastigocoleus sp. MO_188.B34 TaxID=3036635 RepID=UPI00263403B7|nr:type I polyketide synthase [Mastigocoleus sp. MO_188.B34]MDJ0697854.1 type I polyketide synthase [Mastigocoleus sp. MO_188.B34]MDJ0772692.1 type I polyketide synthase [Mastigocoleus sp. MO_167.B18]